MIVQIQDVLAPEQVEAIRERLAGDPQSFEDGQKTAGWQAREVKRNEQAAGTTAMAIGKLVEANLQANPVFRAAAVPKCLVKILVSRYRPGMSYGTHVDDALMDGQRTDLSFTLFLSDPDSYAGGALTIEGNDGDSAIKLPPGSLVLYPTTTLHRVEPVTQGERLAVVGWVRSYIRSPEDRDILFDLENAIASLRQAEAGRAILDRLLKVRANLMRKWLDD